MFPRISGLTRSCFGCDSEFRHSGKTVGRRTPTQCAQFSWLS